MTPSLTETKLRRTFRTLPNSDGMSWEQSSPSGGSLVGRPVQETWCMKFCCRRSSHEYIIRWVVWIRRDFVDPFRETLCTYV